MAVEATLPTIIAVTVSALVDSINPCAIGVMVLLVSTMLGSGAPRSKLLKYGLVYVFAVFATYLVAGLGLLVGFTSIPIVYAEYLTVAVSLMVIVAGIIEIKDFFWYGKGFSLAIPPERAKQIHDFMQNMSLKAMIPLGAFVSLVELPCTGGPYLAILTVLAQGGGLNWDALLLLLYYNLLFVAPLLLILLSVFFGWKKVQEIKQAKQAGRGWMRLAIGILLVLLGWVLILIANTTINLL